MTNYQNFSKYDVMNNRQYLLKKAIYLLQNMNACFNIGTVRSKQEDSVLMLPHMNNPNFVMLAVADGMGGLSFGSKASNLALVELIKWFDCLPNYYYYSENKLVLEIEQKLNEIDLLIRNQCNEGGTTLALAIICEYNTVFINIGDSRIYIHRGSCLEQLSIDHSLCFDMFLKKQIEKKDDIRFHKKNHLINSRLGGNPKMLKIQKIVLSNFEYDNILLFTDGVTDYLPDDDIEKISNDNKYHRNLSKILVEHALSLNTTNNNLNNTEYNTVINGGKDNATALVLSKK